MLLAFLGGLVFSMSIIASSSSKMNGAETSRVQEHSFASQESSAEGQQISTLSDESEDNENIVYRPVRMVRKFPEDSEEMSPDRQQALIPTSQTTCICPEVLNKGTLVAIIGSLAFLGFFSTLVLLLAAVIVLRLMDRQSKKEKKEKKDTDATKKSFPLFLKKKKKESLPPARPVPPVPRRPSERIYITPFDQEAVSTYVDPAELHPGPRLRQERKYESTEGAGGEPKSAPEGYVSMHAAPGFSPSAPEGYVSMQAAPGFSTSTPENAYTGMQPAPFFPTSSPEHVYTSVLGPEHSYANVDGPQSESMAGGGEEQMKGEAVKHHYSAEAAKETQYNNKKQAKKGRQRNLRKENNFHIALKVE